MRIFTLCVILSLISSAGMAASKRRIQVMSYNVENLFDTQKDEGKNDWTYLPSNFKGKASECEKIRSRRYRKDCKKINWTDKALKVKLSQIKKVVDENEYGRPEILGLVEVENGNVVGMLAKKLGYKSFKVTTSPDKRGVDVAMLYKESKKLKFLSWKEHLVPADPSHPTRNILEVTFLLDGKHKLTAFVNHWPSQGGPPIARVKAARVLKARIDAIRKTDPKHLFVAMGDFNVIPGDDPHPFHGTLLSDGMLKDVRWTMTRDRKISYDVKNRLAPGTYFFYYGQKWNNLDHIFVSKSMVSKKSKVQADLESFNILAPEFATKTATWDGRYYMSEVEMKKVPWSYNHATTKKSKAGFSDHFPITVEIKF
ncbi:MAG: endonuclease/exonuclease/phosphatase family protein [Bacteriovoracaceae bacterium]|nr:endonuclease/exonuclease/phosphatase family protein [Bacteriovoracaceae bacterium]